jgi:ABC-type branched-subunit amino acid transport system substrate-binding protein
MPLVLHPGRFLVSLVLLALTAPAVLLHGAAELNSQEQRGRQIYRDGTSPSGGEIVALLGEAKIEVPASSVPCASCHGRDGRGRPEGGVSPSDLRWESVTRPYGVTHPGGRTHPSYDERRLKRAIAMGIDPAGNPLHVAMPRFRMTLQDMADLLAYLKRLGSEPEPVVSDTAVRIGVVLPPAVPLAPMGRAVRAAVEAQCAEWNAQGGIYGRKLEPLFLEPPAEPAARRAAVADFLGREQVFAGLAPFFPGADAELASLFEEMQVPAVGPFTLHPRGAGEGAGRFLFYLLPGLETQGRALARFARTLPAGPLAGRNARPAVAAPADPELAATIASIAEPVIRRWERGAFDPAALARELAAVPADPVFFLGSGAEAVALLRAAEPLGWRPRLLVTGAAADPSLLSAPAAFDGRIFVALPAPPDGPPPAWRQLAAGAPGLPREQLSAQLTALAAAEVLAEGLRRTGRELTRDRFIEQLEGFRKLPLVYGPPVSYGPGRRLGSNGAYVVQVDRARGTFAAAGGGGWVEAD